MRGEKAFGGIDCFKMTAALLVVAIHTSPLACFGGSADFVLTRILARVAVPFFFMVTGYFLLPQYLFGSIKDSRPLRRFLKRITFFYFAATLLYLPIGIYAGHWKDIGLLGIIRMLAFDGTFYHLWYFPACITGVLTVLFFGRGFSFQIAAVFFLLFYSIGLLGDSYYGLIANLPVLSAFYEAMFSIFSYTRNGIFYAPIFLIMGAWLAKGPVVQKRAGLYTGFAVSMAAMLAEGLMLHEFKLQRHDSMYIALIPCMFYLFQIILSWNFKPHRALRTISLWIYLIHPFVIVLVRGGAKAVHLEELFIENSVIHFFAVCVVSCIMAVCAEIFYSSKKIKIRKK